MLHKRIFMSLFGVIICAISVGIFKLASFGVDPFQSFMSGLSSVIPISFGTLYVIVNLLLLSFAFLPTDTTSESQPLSICFCSVISRSLRMIHCKSCFHSHPCYSAPSA